MVQFRMRRVDERGQTLELLFYFNYAQEFIFLENHNRGIRGDEGTNPIFSKSR